MVSREMCGERGRDWLRAAPGGAGACPRLRQCVLPVNRYRPIYRHSGGSRQRAKVVVTTGTTRGPDATVALGRGVQEPMSVGNWAKGGKRHGFLFSTFRETSYNGWGESGLVRDRSSRGPSRPFDQSETSRFIAGLLDHFEPADRSGRFRRFSKTSRSFRL